MQKLILPLSWKDSYEEKCLIHSISYLVLLILLTHTIQDKFIVLLALEITPLSILIPHLREIVIPRIYCGFGSRPYNIANIAIK